MQRSAWALPVVFLLCFGTAGAQPTTDIIDGAEGRLALKVYKTGLMSGKVHTFVFDRFHGKLHFDPESPSLTTVSFTVESDSIRCLDNWVSEKDRASILKEARGNMLAVNNPVRGPRTQGRRGDDLHR